MQSNQNIQVSFVLGVPGSGKGTLCAKLAEQFPLYHLSTGDYLRSLSEGERHFDIAGVMNLHEYLQDRRLLPPKVIVEILAQKASLEYERGYKLILIDGFPRTKESAELFEQVVAGPAFVIQLDCPGDIAKVRFLHRARGDDSSQIFDQRRTEFEANNPLILGRYRNVVHTIDTNTPIEVAYERFAETVSRWIRPFNEM